MKLITLTVIGLSSNSGVAWRRWLGFLIPCIRSDRGRHIKQSKLLMVTFAFLYLALFNWLAWGQDEFSTLAKRNHSSGSDKVTEVTGLAKDSFDSGLGLMKEKKYGEAVIAFKEAIRLKPDIADAHFGLGMVYLKMAGDAVDHNRVALHALLKNHKNAEADAQLRGTAHSAHNYYQEALAAFEQAIRLKSDDVGAYAGMGAAYYGLGRYQEAKAAYKKAVLLEPDNAEAHAGLGATYYCLNHPRGAAEYYREAIRLNPNDAEVHYRLAMVYDDLGWYKEASKAWKEVVRLKHDDAHAHFRLGMAYLLSDNPGAALEEYKTLQKLAPEQADKLLQKINYIYGR